MSSIYASAREIFLTWLLTGTGAPVGAADVCVIGVKSSYVFDTAHETLADVPGTDIVIAEVVLSSVTLTGGVTDAADLALTGLTPGPTLDALIVYAKWAATEQLLCYIDAATDSSLPLTLSTSKMNISWPIAGIFKI